MHTRFLTIAAAVALAVSAPAAPTFATPIAQNFGFALNGTPFYAGAPDTVWRIQQPDEYSPAPTLGSGTIRNGLVSGNAFTIANGEVTISWTGNELNQDLSSGGRAEATFFGGGTLILTGKLRAPTGFPTKPVVWDSADHNGQPILTATVGSFHLQETLVGSNKLQTMGDITLTPTGGYLFSECTTVNVRGPYNFSMLTADTSTLSGGNLVNFSDPLKTLSSFQITFNSVPEPGALLLLGMGAMSLMVRKPRR